MPPLRWCSPTRRGDFCPRRRRASLVRSLPPCRAHQTRFLARCMGRVVWRLSFLLDCRLFPLRGWLLTLLARRLVLFLRLLMLAIQPLKFFSSGPPVEDVAGDVGVVALAGENDDFEVLQSTVSTQKEHRPRRRTTTPVLSAFSITSSASGSFWRSFSEPKTVARISRQHFVRLIVVIPVAHRFCT